jgi:hypothetical protein
MRPNSILFTVVGVLALISPLAAQESNAASDRNKQIDADIALMRSDYKADRSEYVLNAMDLSADERAKFTPIYEKYAAEYSKIGDTEEALIKKFAGHFDTMDNATAKEITASVFKMRTQKNDLLASYAGKFDQVLPATKTARFVQIQILLDNAMGLQIMSQLPLIR